MKTWRQWSTGWCSYDPRKFRGKSSPVFQQSFCPDSWSLSHHHGMHSVSTWSQFICAPVCPISCTAAAGVRRWICSVFFLFASLFCPFFSLFVCVSFCILSFCCPKAVCISRWMPFVKCWGISEVWKRERLAREEWSRLLAPSPNPVTRVSTM